MKVIMDCFETIESKQINDFLKTLVKVPLTDQPLFRLVWSDNQLEHRRITAGKDLGQILIKPKYWWVKSRWVFEQWYPPDIVQHEDLPFTRQGSYEPLYVFEDKHGNPLALNKRVIEFMVNHILDKPKSSDMLIKSTLEEEQAIKEKEDDLDIDRYFDTSSDIMSNLHFGEGIIVPSNYGDIQ